jgi:CRP-like cAMP-binding protein
MDKFKQFLKEYTPISESEMEESIPFFSIQEIKKGALFQEQGVVCRKIGFVLNGILRSYFLNEKSEEITTCFCTENSFTTSFNSFILQQPSNLTIRAIEPAQMVVIEYNTLQNLYMKVKVWNTIGRILTEREYIVMENYVAGLNGVNSKEKYLRLVNDYPRVVEKAKVEDIASYLGVTRRTLSRIRNELSRGI